MPVTHSKGVAVLAAVIAACSACGVSAETKALTAAERSEVNLIVGGFFSASKTSADRAKMVDRVLQIGPPGPNRLHAVIGRRLGFMDKAYRRAFERAASAAGKKKMSAVAAAEGLSHSGFGEKVRAQRSAVLELREDRALSTQKIVRIADPAMKWLGESMKIDRPAVLDGDEALRKRRSELVELWRLWDRCGAAEGGREPSPDPEAVLKAFEQIAVIAGMPNSFTSMRTIQGNVAPAEKIKPEEAECIRKTNYMRLLLGLRVLKIDLKLCQAARGHSTDMKTRRFFNHVSPVPGKRTFNDRARQAGTTACGENLHYGSRTGNAAATAWFHSPDHFKVMLHDIHKRIGVGYDGKWTQMFGY